MPLESDQPIREVGVRELKHRTSQVLRTVIRGDRVIVTKHGTPIAVILCIDEAADLLLASAEEFVRMRVDARAELGRSA